MNAKAIEDIAGRVIEEVELADKNLDEQFEGMGPGLSEVDDEVFYYLFLMRQAEYGPDFADALNSPKDIKDPNGPPLFPNGRAQLRRFMRIQQQRMALEWNPEPYEEEQDGTDR